MSHLKTWMLWLEQISPMQKTVTNFSSDERRIMAEALSLAAPEGPAGFKCVDECRCGEHRASMWSAMMYAAIAGKLGRHSPDGVMQRFRNALESDFLRPRRLDFPVDDLAQVSTIVSKKTMDISSARMRFRRLWEVIQAVIDES